MFAAEMASLYSLKMITLVVLLYANAGINPNFKCRVSMSGFKALFIFSLDISKPPNSNSVMFLVNNTTVDTIRLYNSTCYNKNRACTKDMCECAYTGNVFRMKYVYKTDTLNISTMFGIQMTLKDKNGKGMQMTLRRLFDGKKFGKLLTVNTPIAHDFTQKETIVSTTKKSSGPGDKGVLTAVFIIVAVFGMFLKLWYAHRSVSTCIAA